MRSTAVPGYLGSIIGDDDDDDTSVPEEEFSLDDDALGFWISPFAEITNADALLLLLPVETAAAAKVENRVLADADANEKTIEE